MQVRVRNTFAGFEALKTLAEVGAALSASSGPITFATGPSIQTGTGDPTNVVQAAQGSLFLRTDGGAATTLYVKTGPLITNWTAK
jgi:hypothetical protein